MHSIPLSYDTKQAIACRRGGHQLRGGRQRPRQCVLEAGHEVVGLPVHSVGVRLLLHGHVLDYTEGEHCRDYKEDYHQHLLEDSSKTQHLLTQAHKDSDI